MLSTPLAKALRTTNLHVRRLSELGLTTVADLLRYFPHRYTDSSDITRILDVQLDAVNTVRGKIRSMKNSPAWRRGGISVTTALVSDESGSIEAVWFNQTYLGRTLAQGSEIMLSGKVKLDKKKNRIMFSNPTVEVIRPEQIHTARIVPVYHETGLNAPKSRVRGKISSKWIREKLFPLMPFADMLEEFLPEEIRTAYGLIAYGEAIKQVHFPESEKKLEEAKHRLAFDELFLLQLAALTRRYKWRQGTPGNRNKISANWELIKSFTQGLPWPLTNAQKKSIYEIIKDMEGEWPMTRLLEGDTGSGKTVVAAAAALHTIKAGGQVCLLAPTEILARQHFKTFQKVLGTFNITPTLLLGSHNVAEKRKIREELKNGEISLAIGTHALLQEGIRFKSLKLAIIDEQHRFGVRQRELLKSFDRPHMLSMTATPIPRTLALVLYGDQDLSVLDEMPPGRQKIMTRVVPEEKRAEAYRWIDSEIKKGRQAFFVFPLINESEALDIKAATQEWERLSQKIYPHLNVGLLHGKMEADEKEKTMRSFSEGRIHILVSTAVIEVGVDVSNATIMVIEGAERFGLAQLHQFRGRVGRGSHQSYCLLFLSLQNPKIMSRLQALVKYDSGFKLAEIDLALRGPGEVYGTSQSGIPDLRMAALSDSVTIKQSREAAEEIIRKDPEFKLHQELQKKIAEQENVVIDY